MFGGTHEDLTRPILGSVLFTTERGGEPRARALMYRGSSWSLSNLYLFASTSFTAPQRHDTTPPPGCLCLLSSYNLKWSSSSLPCFLGLFTSSGHQTFCREMDITDQKQVPACGEPVVLSDVILLHNRDFPWRTFVGRHGKRCGACLRPCDEDSDDG